MDRTQDILRKIERRRKSLGMSCQALARRSGLSLRTVQRALSGSPAGVQASSLVAMAHAVGADVDMVHERRLLAVQKEQARAKARRLAAWSQGSAALEGQAVPPSAVNDATDRLAIKLLSGPPIRLWS